MFDIAWGEFVVIAVVALIVIGPKELPGVLRTMGQWTTKIRRMAAEFQGQFQEALREAEMADLKKEVENLNDAAKGFTSEFHDPLNLKEATKWEPKPSAGEPDAEKPGDPAKPVDAPPESTPAAPPPLAGDDWDEAFPAPAAHPAIEQAASLSSAAGGVEQGGATVGQTPTSPVAPPVAQQPPVPEGSQKGGEGGVHS